MTTAVAKAALPFRIPRGGRDPGGKGAEPKRSPQLHSQNKIKEEREFAPP